MGVSKEIPCEIRSCLWKAMGPHGAKTSPCGPMALHKQPRILEEIFLSTLFDEEPKKMVHKSFLKEH